MKHLNPIRNKVRGKIYTAPLNSQQGILMVKWFGRRQPPKLLIFRGFVSCKCPKPFRFGYINLSVTGINHLISKHNISPQTTRQKNTQ